MINRTKPIFGIKTGTKFKLNSAMLLEEITWVSTYAEKIFFMLEKKKFHPYLMPFHKSRTVFNKNIRGRNTRKANCNI